MNLQSKTGKLAILLVEDDDNDAMLIQRAFQRINAKTLLLRAEDGSEAVDYLSGQGKFADRKKFPLPGLLITDLKMPKKNGFELLKWLRASPVHRAIPAIVLTSSMAQRDVSQSYVLGANCYLVKPGKQEELTALLADICRFWSRCELPQL